MPGKNDPEETGVTTVDGRRNEDVWVVIPVFNEAPVLESVVRQVLEVFPNVVCVDDGSKDHTAEILTKVATGTNGTIIVNTATITASNQADHAAANNSTSYSLPIQAAPISMPLTGQ